MLIFLSRALCRSVQPCRLRMVSEVRAPSLSSERLVLGESERELAGPVLVHNNLLPHQNPIIREAWRVGVLKMGCPV